MKDPAAGRVAPERGGPSRERRPPRLSGAGKQRRRIRAVHQTCSCHCSIERPARLSKKRNRTLEGSANRIHCLRQWRGRGLSSVRWRLLIFLADPVRARGKQKTPSPGDFNRQSATSAPAHLGGALRGVPAEGVAGDSVAAPGQGKAFPKHSSKLHRRSCQAICGQGIFVGHLVQKLT